MPPQAHPGLGRLLRPRVSHDRCALGRLVNWGAYRLMGAGLSIDPAGGLSIECVCGGGYRWMGGRGCRQIRMPCSLRKPAHDRVGRLHLSMAYRWLGAREV